MVATQDQGPEALCLWSLASGPVLPWDQSGERDQDERTRGYGAERSARTPRNSDPREAGWSPRPTLCPRGQALGLGRAGQASGSGRRAADREPARESLYLRLPALLQRPLHPGDHDLAPSAPSWSPGVEWLAKGPSGACLRSLAARGQPRCRQGRRGTQAEEALCDENRDRL